MKHKTASSLRDEIHQVINKFPAITKLDHGDYTLTLPKPWSWRGVIAAANENGQLDSLPLLRKTAAVYKAE